MAKSAVARRGAGTLPPTRTEPVRSARPTNEPRHTTAASRRTADAQAARTAAEDAKPAVGATIKVRATQLGYYGDERRRVGDVFTLRPRKGTFTEQVLDKDGEPKTDKLGFVLTKEVKKTLSAADQFSEKWMEKVSADTPERVTTGKEDLRRQHDEELAARTTGRARSDDNPLDAED